MDLGLEHLATQKDEPVVLGFEDLFNEIEFARLSDEVSQELININTLCSTYDTLCEIGCTIKKYGVTESLVDIFGQNYSGAASMEAENEEAKESVFKRIWEAIKAFFQKVYAWFKALFQNNVKVIKALGELKRKADTLKYPIKAPVTIAREWQNAMKIIPQFIQYVISEKEVTEETLESKFKSFFGNYFDYVSLSLKKLDVDSEIKNSNDLKQEIDLVISTLESIYKVQKDFSRVEDVIKSLIDSGLKEREQSTGKENNVFIKGAAWTARKVALFEIWTLLKSIGIGARQTANLLLMNAKPATEEK